MEAVAGVVERARNGAPEAFWELVEAHSEALFRLAYRLTGNESMADDVVQETFLKAHRNLHRFDGRAQLRIWLCRITANCAIDEVRKKAVFALSQLEDGDGVAPLIELMRSSRETAIRKEAFFWLGQMEDPRAMEALEALLLKN